MSTWVLKVYETFDTQARADARANVLRNFAASNLVSARGEAAVVEDLEDDGDPLVVLRFVADDLTPAQIKAAYDKASPAAQRIKGRIYLVELVPRTEGPGDVGIVRFER